MRVESVKNNFIFTLEEMGDIWDSLNFVSSVFIEIDMISLMLSGLGGADVFVTLYLTFRSFHDPFSRYYNYLMMSWITPWVILSLVWRLFWYCCCACDL